jgi:class 3 adenylate cyclase
VTEPRIQYAKTADGVSIAFWTLGGGLPLVCTPLIPSHAELEWHDPDFRSWFELLSKNRQLIHYDGRGAGLSDRNVTDFSLDALVSDIGAVADRLRLDQFALFSGFHFGPAAVAYSARYPERVSHLILWCTWGRTADFYRSPPVQALGSLRDKDWGIYSETLAHAFSGFSGGDRARRIAALLRQSVVQDAVLAFVVAAQKFDVTALLPQVSSPTLVIHRREMGLVPVDLARQLASGIRDARLTLIDGESIFPFASDEVALREIDEFLGVRVEPSPLETTPPSGTAIILFADIVDSTALTERLGDNAFRDKARDLDAALRTIIRDNAGTPIEGKLLGDGVLAVFTSARQAIEAALACGRAGEDGGLPLHLGLHAGDVIRESDPDGRSNVYGGAVNIAARISSLSAPGEVLVSDTVRSLARTSAGAAFEDRGEQALKGVGEPVRVWAVVEAG